MDELDERVIGCFRVVFPELSDEQIHGANTSTLSEWDSLASLSLVAVLEEEFACMFDDAVVGKLDSFAAARAAVEHAAP
jgi:acyl carrier protein